MRDRDVGNAAVEIVIGTALWFGAVYVVVAPGSELDFPLAFTGSLVIALIIGWWRIIRHGPGATRLSAAPPAWLDRRMLVLSGVLGLLVGVSFLPEIGTDDAALAWFLIFTIGALIQFWRAWRSR
jgi:hypothetical protein